MINQFSRRVSDVIQFSREEAERLNCQSITSGHLLLGILREGEGKAVEILKAQGVDTEKLKFNLEVSLRCATLPGGENELNFDETASRIIKMSLLEARLLKAAVADTEHLLLAIMREEKNNACSELKDAQVSYETIMDYLKPKTNLTNGFDLDDEEDDEEEMTNHRSGSSSQSSSSTQANSQQVHTQQQAANNDTPVLDVFGVDVTKAAEEGKLDPVVGREKEIERLAQILSRRKKNNPVLIGDPGVGKSALVEGLALRIVEKKVSRILFNKRVVSLDMAAVVAGTKYRGQFEERIRSIMNELKNNPNIILFIDEIHTIVGAGSAAGTMDAANMLKPALSRGEIQCIGATTIDEYRKSIEKDGALERRFQKVVVGATTPEETLQILKNIKDKYEEHHNVNYTDAALEACVKLADRYITDRSFPDKAIDLMDEAGSRVHLINISAPAEIEEQEKKVEEARSKKGNAVRMQDFELAASFRDEERRLMEELEVMKQRWEEQLKENRETVDEAQIAQVASMISGVPVQRMAQEESVRLRALKDELLGKVIAQDKAVDIVTKAIRRSRVGLKDPNKPIGTFLFLGPTGVGKTHLAKELAKQIFGSSDALIRIDMSEYMEKFSVSRLVGAPPGYVGYEDGGQLTERVRRKPYSIVLLDEIEKANADVYNLLLQVMDEGRLTDSNGRTVDFKNTIIIMTSNIGTRQLKEFKKGIGFTTQTEASSQEHSHSVIQKALHKTFSPEFINRLDEIITFDHLDLPALVRIVDIELKGLYARVEQLGYKLILTEEAKNFIASQGCDVEFGARPLKRAIQTHLEDGLSELVLNEEPQEGDSIYVHLNETGDALRFEVKRDA